jgi:hypothetical protein
MNQDQYGALLQKFIEQEKEVSRRELQLVQAKANLTGYQVAHVDGPYVDWETAEGVAQRESEVVQAEKALREAREDLGPLKASLVGNLPVKNIGVVVHLKHADTGPSALRIKAVPREGARGENPADFALFIEGKEY